MHYAASWRVVMADVGEKGVLWPALVLSEEQLQALVNNTHHIQVSATTAHKAHTTPMEHTYSTHSTYIKHTQMRIDGPRSECVRVLMQPPMPQCLWMWDSCVPVAADV